MKLVILNHPHFGLVLACFAALDLDTRTRLNSEKRKKLIFFFKMSSHGMCLVALVPLVVAKARAGALD